MSTQDSKSSLAKDEQKTSSCVGKTAAASKKGSCSSTFACSSFTAPTADNALPNTVHDSSKSDIKLDIAKGNHQQQSPTTTGNGEKVETKISTDSSPSKSILLTTASASSPPLPMEAPRLYCDFCPSVEGLEPISFRCGHLLDYHVENEHGIIFGTSSPCSTANCEYAILALPDRENLLRMPKQAELDNVVVLADLGKADDAAQQVKLELGELGSSSSKDATEQMPPPSKKVTSDFLKKARRRKKRKSPGQKEQGKSCALKEEAQDPDALPVPASAKPTASKTEPGADA